MGHSTMLERLFDSHPESGTESARPYRPHESISEPLIWLAILWTAVLLALGAYGFPWWSAIICGLTLSTANVMKNWHGIRDAKTIALTYLIGMGTATLCFLFGVVLNLIH